MISTTIIIINEDEVRGGGRMYKMGKYSKINIDKVYNRMHENIDLFNHVSESDKRFKLFIYNKFLYTYDVFKVYYTVVHIYKSIIFKN